jgi:hypothetical protein
MQAGVVERRHGIGRAPHQQNGVVADRVLDPGSHRRDLFLAAGDLPDARPETFELRVEKGALGVALLRDEAVIAEEG